MNWKEIEVERDMSGKNAKPGKRPLGLETCRSDGEDITRWSQETHIVVS